MRIAITGIIGSGKSTVINLLREVGEICVSADEINAENSRYVSAIFEAIPAIAKAEGLTKGYRVITNCGDDACQTVKHLHFHVMGGRALPENMG